MNGIKEVLKFIIQRSALSNILLQYNNKYIYHKGISFVGIYEIKNLIYSTQLYNNNEKIRAIM